MKKKYLLIWLIILVCFMLAIKLTTKATKDLYYQEKEQATYKTLMAYQTIKQYRLNHDISLSDPSRNNKLLDPQETGLLGYWLSDITTTTGDLEAKKRSINPAFAAVVIDMLVKANIKAGDEVGVLASGSFPALTIAVLCALEVYQVKACVIASIGSSSYGANIPDLTIFDMIQILLDEDILHHNLDYVSFGGVDDTGNEFAYEVKESILNRINSRAIPLLDGGAFPAIITNHLNAYQAKIPNIKLFINIGGHVAALGEGKATYLGNNGLIFKTKRLFTAERGLINRYLEQNIPVIHFLNILSLAQKYELLDKAQIDLNQAIYYDNQKNFILIIIPLTISFCIFIIVLIRRKKLITIAI